MTINSIAIVGCGVLGTSLCKQILSCPEMESVKVWAITKTRNNHESIKETVGENPNLNIVTMDDLTQETKFENVVFCAPPSGSDDYPGAVKDAVDALWCGPDKGRFVFTSSGGIYGPGNGEVVKETSPLPESTMASSRSLRLVKAEENALSAGGCVLRLAGLYTLDRGAHNYWLEKSGGMVKGSKDGIINLLHYDDAAGACLAALMTDNDVRGKVFLISDGNPTTRIGICESALKAKRYGGLQMPSFGEDGTGAGKGKIYDGTFSNAFLKWKPRYESFDTFMTSSQ